MSPSSGDAVVNGQILCPGLHQSPTFFEQVASRVRRLGLALDRVRQGHLHHGVWGMRLFGRVVAETRPKPVHDGVEPKAPAAASRACSHSAVGLHGHREISALSRRTTLRPRLTLREHRSTVERDARGSPSCARRGASTSHRPSRSRPKSLCALPPKASQSESRIPTQASTNG